MKKIRKCSRCNRYTLMKNCPSCSMETGSVGPARYSPEDRYGTYRRMMKKD